MLQWWNDSVFTMFYRNPDFDSLYGDSRPARRSAAESRLRMACSLPWLLTRQPPAWRSTAESRWRMACSKIKMINQVQNTDHNIMQIFRNLWKSIIWHVYPLSALKLTAYTWSSIGSSNNVADSHICQMMPFSRINTVIPQTASAFIFLFGMRKCLSSTMYQPCNILSTKNS